MSNTLTYPVHFIVCKLNLDEKASKKKNFPGYFCVITRFFCGEDYSIEISILNSITNNEAVRDFKLINIYIILS